MRAENYKGSYERLRALRPCVPLERRHVPLYGKFKIHDRLNNLVKACD